MRIKRRIFTQTGADMYIMVSEKNGKSVYMPLYVHTFRLNTACTYAETIKFREICKKPEALTETADKLRFLRHKLGWYQSDVASYIGISRSLYKNYETVGDIQCYPISVLEKLSKLYNVDIAYLMDDYNLFLYKGQSEQIKQSRMKLGLKRSEFADMLNVNRDLIRVWETGEKHITKKSYEKIKHMIV